MKVAEVIEKVKTNKYWSLYEFEEDFDLEAVARDLNLDRLRWYEISTVVYKCEDGFVGVSGVSRTYSEMMDYRDCLCECTAEEFKPVQTINYVPCKQ